MKFMRYIKLFVFIFVPLIALTGCSGASQQGNNSSFSNDDYGVEVSANEAIEQIVDSNEDVLLDTNRGVDVLIEKVIREDNKTVIYMSMSNHVYNLEEFDVLQWSFLDGVKAIEYIIDESNMGGHHINSRIVFSSELGSLLIIGFDEDFIFRFSI